jgi:prepilin-type N-terminal cleavage/methylation domain-containing protein
MKQLHRLRLQHGFTLVEQLVVIVLISIVGMIGFRIATGVLGTYLQNVNLHIMRQEQADLNGYIYGASYLVKAGDLAPNSQNPSVVQAVALAGDQLTWCYNSTFNNKRWCVRIFYVSRWRRIFEIQAPETAYGAIVPVRGPNQTVPARANCPAPCYVAAPGSPLYDQVLDGVFQELGGANQIASNVSLGSANITSMTVTSNNAPFKYWSPTKQRLTFVPSQASSSTLGLTLAQKAQIGEIDFDFYLQPPNSAPWAEIPPLHYEYQMTVAPVLD